MLTRSFIHISGIGPHRERALWRRGYVDWRRFIADHPAGPWRDRIVSFLNEEAALRSLPRREAWRMFPTFRDRVAYLDIETDGLDVGPDGVTCIGLSDGRTVEAFVQGDNLHDFPRALARFDLLVTYNGSSFDLPVLRQAFPQVDFDRLQHIDLRYPLHRLGFRGGLKGVERQLGLERAEEVRGVDGYAAVLLWRAHQRGRSGALETLVRYCLEDVVNLKPLMAHAFNELTRSMPIDVECIRDLAVPRIPYRSDPGLVRELTARTWVG